MMSPTKPATSAKKSPRRRQIARLRHPSLAKVVERNIDSIEEHKRHAEESRTIQERMADAITAVSGSLWFVWIHAAWFGIWILVNLELLGIPAFDPYPFGLLTMIVSLEAIFLSTFVLISQNRQAAIADERAELDLQINLLAEYEITRLLKLQDAMAKHLDVPEPDPAELAELEQDVEPEAVLEKLESNGVGGRASSGNHNRPRRNQSRAKNDKNS
jgi:uncharacterized membrane protein